MRVTGLWRYPVKSMAGQRLERAAVHELGLLGDRQWGVVDLDTGHVLTARRAPELLRAEPVADGDELHVRLPDGSVTDDDAVLSDWLGRRVRLRRPDADERGTYEIAVNDDRPEDEWLQWQGPEGVFHDSARTRVSIISEASLGDWDVRRFRPNVVVSGAGEGDLVGHDVRLGEVTLHVAKPIGRCVIVTRPQPGLDRDKQVLVDVNRHHDGNLGVGAVVRSPGTVAVGDPVERC